ncbi:hypothetical protein V1281_007027 [Nitrobacteraceae bacterium AZCC 2161]
MHRVREWLVSQRTGIINQIRAFLLERGIAVRQGLRFLRAELPDILARPSDILSPAHGAGNAGDLSNILYLGSGGGLKIGRCKYPDSGQGWCLAHRSHHK